MNIGKMKSSQRVAAAGLVLLMVLSFVGCNGAVQANAEVSEPDAVAVEVQSLEKSSISNQLTYIGQIQAQRKVSVVSRLSAEVKEVFYDVGDVIKEGDVLFTVDAKDLADQVRQLQASAGQTQVAVDQASYGLQVAREGSDQTKLTELNSNNAVTNAKIGLEDVRVGEDTVEDRLDQAEDAEDAARSVLKDQQNYLRELRLGMSGNYPVGGFPVTAERIADQEKEVARASNLVDQASTAAETARNAYDNYHLNVDRARNAVNYAEKSRDISKDLTVESQTRSIQQASYALRSAEAAANTTSVQLANLQSNLQYAQVKSPLSGVVAERNIEVGQMIGQQQMPFTIIEMETVNVQVEVSETLINTIFPGDEVTVTIQALGGELRTGVVTAVSPAAGQNSTYPIRVQLDNSDGAIKPGMFAQVSFVKEHKENTFVVDKNVVKKDGQNEYVYVIRDGQAQKVVVTTGISNGTTIEILSGVSVGDVIVVVGQEYLSEGRLVNVVKENGVAVKKTEEGQPNQQSEAAV